MERIFGYAMRTCVQMVDRRVRCRGDNTDSELISSLSPGIVSSWTSLPEVDGAERQSVGPAAAHQCVINSSRELFCWGDDSRAQIGQGVSSTSRPVTRVRP